MLETPPFIYVFSHGADNDSFPTAVFGSSGCGVRSAKLVTLRGVNGGFPTLL